MDMKAYSDIRIGFVGVSHWHAPIYASSMKRLGIPICGACDHDATAREHFAQKYNCPSYSSMDELLDNARPDFVFAFGMHIEMTHIAEHLVNRHIPFVMEKPMGVDWRALALVVRQARAKGLFAGVDLVMRTLPLIRYL
ncbi:MAG TPA: hypothetical protein EYP10_08940, partial [Armatimonadetes bacterium]|nr:hypothetical protein [Armatimonadota bacterium]